MHFLNKFACNNGYSLDLYFNGEDKRYHVFYYNEERQWLDTFKIRSRTEAYDYIQEKVRAH